MRQRDKHSKEEPMAKRKQTAPQNHLTHNHFQLRHIKPLTVNQSRMFDAYKAGQNIVAHGYAGTGKTFVALYLALREVLSETSNFKRVVVIRSVVPSRDMGFLPGSAKQKAEVFERPYQEISDDIFGRGDGWNILKMKHLVEFETTSFLRGVTFRDSIVIVDECNNMNFGELDTTMTRLGDTSRIIFCGDYRQSDLNRPHDKTGILEFMDITRRISSFEHIEFEKSDIVRGGVVKDYIIRRTEMGY
jgi:phosphate starvation-inducible protein PhoH